MDEMSFLIIHHFVVAVAVVVVATVAVVVVVALHCFDTIKNPRKKKHTKYDY